MKEVGSSAVVGYGGSVLDVWVLNWCYEGWIWGGEIMAYVQRMCGVRVGSRGLMVGLDRFLVKSHGLVPWMTRKSFCRCHALNRDGLERAWLGNFRVAA